MKTANVLIWTAGVAMVARFAVGEPERASAATLQDLVRQWSAIRREIAAENREREAKKAQWQREISLLEAEKAALREELSRWGDFPESAAAERLDLASRKERAATTLQALVPVVRRAEANILKWCGRIPPSLAENTEKAFGRIPDASRPPDTMSVSRRLQVVVALYAQIEAMQHSVHVTRELLPLGDGARRECEVIYLGLTRGFAVTADERWAGIGEPGPDGWVWNARPGIASSVRRAIRVFQRQGPAEMVPLPLSVDIAQGPSAGNSTGQPETGTGGTSP